MTKNQQSLETEQNQSSVTDHFEIACEECCLTLKAMSVVKHHILSKHARRKYLIYGLSGRPL